MLTLVMDGRTGHHDHQGREPLGRYQRSIRTLKLNYQLGGLNCLSEQSSFRLAMGDGTEQTIFTMRAPAGEVVKVEQIDATGNRRDLSKEEVAGLIGKREESEIEEALDGF